MLLLAALTRTFVGKRFLAKHVLGVTRKAGGFGVLSLEVTVTYVPFYVACFYCMRNENSSCNA
jgi:hypothetical protein